MSIPTHIRTPSKSAPQNNQYKYLRTRPLAAWRGTGHSEAAVLPLSGDEPGKYLRRALAGQDPAATKRQRLHHAWALVLAACWLADAARAAGAAPASFTAPAVPKAPPSALAAPPSVVSWPEDARISLELRRVPLSELLSVLSAQSGVRFRLATIPDVEVSVSLQNAPLQQAVRDLLAFHGFDLRPGPDAFWLVDAPAPSAPVSEAPDAPRRGRAGAPASLRAAPAAESGSRGSGSRGSGTWRWWTSAQAPPPRWMTLGGAETAFESAPTKSGVPGVAPFGVRVRLQPPLPLLARWKGGVHRFGAASPGVMPAPAMPRTPSATATPAILGSALSSSTSSSAVRWCARWPVFLREVPTRCLLVIESERPANFYINGARLLGAWTGRRTLEVSGSLQPGFNLLALEWPAPASTSTAPPSTSPPPLPAAPPVVRYEWFVAQ